MESTSRFRKYLNKKDIAKYLYDQLTGNFAGFLIGLLATKLVSQFFETRSLHNFWGLTSKKTVVDKETFSNLEWAISILVGFVAFEIVTKVVKEKIDKFSPVYKIKMLRWMVSKNHHTRIKRYKGIFNTRRVALFAGMHGALKNKFNKYSQR